MKCPKCGYQSFNHLPACKKCGRSLLDLQEKLGFDQTATQSLAAAAEEPETSAWQEESIPEDPALEESLQDFFLSLEEPEENGFPAGENAPFAIPPTDDIEPEDSLFDTPNGQFVFEEPDMEELSYSFEEMEEELKTLQEPEPEEKREDQVFVSDDSDPVEAEPKLELPLEESSHESTCQETAEEIGLLSFGDPNTELDTVEEAPLEDPPKNSEGLDQETAKENGFLSFADLNSELDAVEKTPLEEPANFPQSIDRETAEETGFLSFADVDEELWSQEETADDLALEAETAPVELPRESVSGSFVTPQEIERAMARDSASKMRSDSFSPPPLDPALEQEDLPYAASVMPEEVFLREEEESPQRWVLRLRLLAILTDLAILAGIFAAFVVAGEMVRLPNKADWFRFTIDAVLQLATPYFLVLFTLCFGYFTLFHFLTGQTPGKMLWRVRVEGEAGAPLSLAQSFLRTTGGLLALLPAGLGFLPILINSRQRGWNDLLANSRVVEATPEGK